MKRLRLIHRLLFPSLVLSPLLPASRVLAEEELELSLAEILDLKVAVATKKETTLRETPGIVTVITREQILDMGARDLVDILMRVVPGYSLVTEIEGGQLLSIRGLNAIEGKFLLMIDGLDINEEKFGIVQVARHFPIHNMERIEIIRGPGSSIYGGYASLGVINILTRSYNRLGSYAAVELEQGSRSFLNRTVAAGTAVKKGNLKFSSNVVASRALLSDQKATTYYGDEISLSDAAIELASLTFNLKYRDTFVKGIIDLYRAPEYYFDEPDAAPWQHLRERWDTYQVEVGRDFKPSTSLKITPFFNYKLQYPYWVDQGPYWFRNKVDRKTGGVTVQYDINATTNLIGGYQGFVHTLYRAPTLNEAVGEEDLKDNPDLKSISYRNDSIFFQVMNYNPIVNLTTGVRYDKTDIHGEFIAPRIGLTKVGDNIHSKYMLARSFRVPGGIIPNRVEDRAKYEIEPETTLNNEMEIGYRFTDSVWGVVNLFDHLIKKPIVYATGSNGVGSYANGGNLGSRGVEFEARFLQPDKYVTFTYSYYRLTQNDVASAQVPDQELASYGQAQHKMGLVSGYRFTRSFSVNPSLSLIGERFAYTEQGEITSVDADGSEVRAPALLKKLPLNVIANVNVRQAELFGMKGLDGSVAIQNLTDTRFEIAQPYQAEYPVAPIPFSSRSIMTRLQYDF